MDIKNKGRTILFTFEDKKEENKLRPLLTADLGRRAIKKVNKNAVRAAHGAKVKGELAGEVVESRELSISIPATLLTTVQRSIFQKIGEIETIEEILPTTTTAGQVEIANLRKAGAQIQDLITKEITEQQ